MRRHMMVLAACGLIAASTMTPSEPANAQLGIVGAIADGVAGGYAFGGRNYCFYPNGWNGPGWYWCGYAYRNGLGFGGREGWHGWRRGGGHRGGGGFHGGGGGHVGGGHVGGGHGGGRPGGGHGGGHGGGGHGGGGHGGHH